MGKSLRRTLAVLAVIFLLLLGWLGRRLAAEDLEVLKREEERILDGSLQVLSEQVVDLLRNKSGEIRTRLAKAEGSVNGLRRSAMEDPNVQRTFLLDQKGDLLYPLGRSTETPAERDLADLIRPLVTGGQFVQAPKESNTSAHSGSLDNYSWQSILWRDGLHVFLLTPFFNGHTAGLEVNLARLQSDIISALIDASARGAWTPQFDGAVQFLLEDDTVLVELGVRKPEFLPSRQLSLPYPLQQFRLRYYLPKHTVELRSTRLSMTASLLLLGSLLFALSAYAVREHRRELREAEDRMSFIGKVSHELRTPLTSVRLYAQLLERQLDDDDTQSKEYANILVQEAERLSRLISNVLRFREAEGGKLEIRKAPQSPSTVLRSVVHLYEPGFSRRGQELNYTDRTSGNERLLDADAFTQIVHNLLSNTEKYARSGAIHVDLSEDSDMVILEVRDEGPGLDPSLREKIFEPFFRVSNAITDGVSGAGVGLGIARELARLHGGDLTVMPSERGLALRLTLSAPRQVSSVNPENSV